MTCEDEAPRPFFGILAKHRVDLGGGLLTVIGQCLPSVASTLEKTDVSRLKKT